MATTTRATRSRAATAAAATSQPSTSAAAASSSAHIPGTNVYPQGCKEVHEEMHVDELIRRLKTLASTFQSMGQEENAYDEFVPLCLHLAEEGFLNHPSRDVRLLIACCIADILRIYAPEAPYKDPDQVKTIFKFLISQLEGLKDPKDAAFKRYFYLLENLAYVKSFNMCFELDDAQDIFCSLFDLIFSIVNDEHSGKVKSFMLDVLCPLVSECDTVSNELLNIILMNIVEPIKSSKKNAYNLAKELIIKCSETLESYIQNFFNQVLICGGKEDQNLLISHKVYDLIYELNHICPSVLLSVIPQLEYKLKSPDEAERLGSVSLLARMFSEKESNLATHHAPLWQAFLSRFNDISVAIRTKCVQYSMHFLLNHAELRDDIVETLRLRQHDAEENVRYEVVKAIVATAKLDFNIVSDSEDLLNYVKERTLDKKFKIRREALQGLALIYKKYLGMENVPEPTDRAAAWMKDKILHGYYMVLLDDRILVERLLNTCLVPYQLDPKDRMMKLLYLYSTIDKNATKAFIEIQKNLVLVRRQVSDLLAVIRNHETKVDFAKQLNFRISSLTKFLPDPVKASEFICKFSNDLKDDKALMRTMEIIVSPTTDCKTCAESVNMVLKKLGAPVMTNLYYNTIKILLERTSSVLIDKDAITKLVTIMKEIVDGNSDFFKSFNVPTEVVIEKGFDLISVLAFVFANHFDEEKVLETLIKLLSNEHLGSERVSSILAALMYIGKIRPIGQHHPSLMGVLVPQCQNMLVTGTPRQGKMAVRCLHVNMKESARNHTFAQVVEALRANLDPSNTSYCTAIVALGHIALLMPEEFKYDMKAIISQKIVKELLVNPRRTYDDHLKNSDNWCDEEDLPEITRCMVHGMKTTVRWLMGLKTDFKSAAKTFKMLTAFVETGGTFINAEVPFSDSEKAWLRLAAGSCMLKICEQKGVGDQFTAVQFCSLAKLMNDEVEQVRSRFANKLHKGLSRGIPHKCLPLDFMGFYALVGYETDKQLRATARNYMVADVNRRRDYIKSLLMNASDKASDQLPHIMPDYMLVFAVPVLTHNPKFTAHGDTDQLTAIRECLWFILEPLIVKNDSYSFGFYKTLIERMKNHKNALEPENEEANARMYSICDIALGLILQRSSSFEMKEHPSEPRIPPMYFKRPEDPYWVNQRVYLPAEMQYTAPKKAGVTVNIESTTSTTTTGPEAAGSSAATGSGKKNSRKGKRDSAQVVDEHGNVSIDAQPTDAKLTRLEIPGIHKSSESGDEGEGNNNENNENQANTTTTSTTASVSQANRNLRSTPGTQDGKNLRTSQQQHKETSGGGDDNGEDETIEAIQEEVSKVIQTKGSKSSDKAENGVTGHQKGATKQGNAVAKGDTPSSRPATRVTRKRNAKDSEDESSDSSAPQDKQSSSPSKDIDGISTRKSASAREAKIVGLRHSRNNIVVLYREHNYDSEEFTDKAAKNPLIRDGGWSDVWISKVDSAEITDLLWQNAEMENAEDLFSYLRETGSKEDDIQEPCILTENTTESEIDSEETISIVDTDAETEVDSELDVSPDVVTETDSETDTMTFTKKSVTDKTTQANLGKDKRVDDTVIKSDVQEACVVLTTEQVKESEEIEAVSFRQNHEKVVEAAQNEPNSFMLMYKPDIILPSHPLLNKSMSALKWLEEIETTAEVSINKTEKSETIVEKATNLAQYDPDSFILMYMPDNIRNDHPMLNKKMSGLEWLKETDSKDVEKILPGDDNVTQTTEPTNQSEENRAAICEVIERPNNHLAFISMYKPDSVLERHPLLSKRMSALEWLKETASKDVEKILPDDDNVTQTTEPTNQSEENRAAICEVIERPNNHLAFISMYKPDGVLENHPLLNKKMSALEWLNETASKDVEKILPDDDNITRTTGPTNQSEENRAAICEVIERPNNHLAFISMYKPDGVLENHPLLNKKMSALEWLNETASKDVEKILPDDDNVTQTTEPTNQSEENGAAICEVIERPYDPLAFISMYKPDSVLEWHPLLSKRMSALEWLKELASQAEQGPHV